VLSLITDTLEQTDDLPYLDRVLGAAALELTPDELALAAEHFGNRMPRRGMAFLRQARLEAEEAEQEAWERFQARGNRAKVADLVRRARTLWMQALLGLRHEGSQIAPNPERALGMCLLGVGDAEAALPMLEATEAWDYAARAAWHLGDYAKADRYYQQTTRELSPYDARCKALVAKLAQR